MRRSEVVVLIVLTVAGGSMVAVANFTRNYIPLFFAWVLFGAIPFAFGALEQRRAKQES